jgi:hypothetical protein
MGKRLPKRELLEEIGAERDALDGLLNQLTPREMTQRNVTAAGWSVKDILGHLVGWQQMNLEWYEAGERGEAPAMPAPGLTWKDLRKLNDMIYKRHRRRALGAVLKDYVLYHQRMLELLRRIPDADLVLLGRFSWTGPSWTLSDYIRATPPATTAGPGNTFASGCERDRRHDDGSVEPHCFDYHVTRPQGPWPCSLGPFCFAVLSPPLRARNPVRRHGNSASTATVIRYRRARPGGLAYRRLSTASPRRLAGQRTVNASSWSTGPAFRSSMPPPATSSSRN